MVEQWNRDSGTVKHLMVERWNRCGGRVKDQSTKKGKRDGLPVERLMVK